MEIIVFESSIFEPRNQFNLLPHSSHTPAYVKAHKSFDRSDLFRNNEIIVFSCILSLRYIERRIISPVPGSPITENLSFFSNSCQQNIFPPFTCFETISYFLWLTAFLMTAFLANQHDHLFPREPINQWEFSVRTEKNRLGDLSGRRYFHHRGSPFLTLLAFFSRHIDFSRACHPG